MRPALAAKSGSRGNPTAVLPRTKSICIQPTPQGSAADLSHQALRHRLPLDIGEGESREREAQTIGCAARQTSIPERSTTQTAFEISAIRVYTLGVDCPKGEIP